MMDSVVDTDSFFFLSIKHVTEWSHRDKGFFQNCKLFLDSVYKLLGIEISQVEAEIVPGTCFCFVFFGISLVKDPQELGRQ